MENYRLEQTGQEVQDILNGAAMQTDLTAENERAEGAEQTLQGNIDEEERRAKAAEETLSGAIGDEELRAKAAEEALGGAIDGINAKIPAAASSENKLADQDFVNSSIETATATFRGTYNLVSDLHLAVDATHAQIATLLGTVIAEADNNDYSYVLIPTSAQTPTEIASIEKYTFGANGWAFAYALNNSGFTSAQWAAINSGITSGLVAKLNALPTNTDLLALLAGKQDVLTFDDVPVEGSNNPVKSGGVHSAIDDEKTARVNAVNGVAGRVDTIEGEIPAQASSENQLADKAYVNSSISTNTATYRGSFNLVADLGLSVSATHEQIGTALAGEISTADNNDYAYVQVPTSDETPAQILKVERYKFNGTAWAFEYELNNSGFTSAQWAALNSGITSGLVGKLNALPTNDELTLALAGKQDVLTFDNTPTENSNNPVKSGGVYAADKTLSDAIEAILLLIPSAATSLNKLVDTDLMNSSISTATATFRGTFNLVSDLSLDLTATHAQIATALAGAIATADNNDYCFVQIPTAVGTPTEIAQTDRYKFNGTAWAFEYTLNNSGFTASQWAAINSAITTELVAKLTALPTNAELLESLGLLSSGISGINAKIPSAASSENKLVDGTAMETYVAQIVNAIDATFNVTSTDGHVTLAITQVNGAITSVQLTTSDIASAAALNLKASQADLTALAGRVTTAEGNITSLTGRMTTAEGDIDQLLALYNALQQSAPQVIQPTDTWPVANPSTTVIYRVIDRVNTPPQYYSDYMWNGTAFVLMATYNNAVDAVPTAGSNNLVNSGGVMKGITVSTLAGGMRNGTYGNPGNQYAVSTTFIPISGKGVYVFETNRPNTSGYRYAFGYALTRSKNDLFKAPRIDQMEGFILHKDYSDEDKYNNWLYINMDYCVGIGFNIVEYSIADGTTLNPLRVSDFDGYYLRIVPRSLEPINAYIAQGNNLVIEEQKGANNSIFIHDMFLCIRGLDGLGKTYNNNTEIASILGVSLVNSPSGVAGCIALWSRRVFVWDNKAREIAIKQADNLTSDDLVLIECTDGTITRLERGLLNGYIRYLKDEYSKDVEIPQSLSKAEEFNALFKGATGDVEPFLYFSDPHFYPDYWTTGINRVGKKALKEIKRYFNNTATNFVLCGGDWLTRHKQSIAIKDLAQIDGITKAFFGDKYYPVFGNHDNNYQGEKDETESTTAYDGVLSNQQMVNLMFRRWNSVYYTFLGSSSRFYVFDSGIDWSTQMDAYKWGQVDWFAKQLLANNEDHIILATHIAELGPEHPEDFGNDMTPVTENVLLVAQAFNARQSVTLNGETYDFSSKTGKIACMLCGHTHYDANAVVNDIPVYCITTSKDDGTFDLILVDYGTNTLKSVRVGTGSNRSISLA